MTCACDVIDYLYFDRNLDDEEIIETLLDGINQCLTHLEENSYNEVQMEDIKREIHNKMLVIMGGYEYVR